MALHSLLGSAADLLLPRCCLGCGLPGVALCSDCAGRDGPARAHRPDPVPPGFPPTWVAGRYAGALRTAILAYKERGRADLCPVLAGRLAAAVRAAVPAGPVLLVPIPSTPAAARRRGGDHLRRLARSAAPHCGGTVLPLLRMVGRPQDSAGLTAGQRAANLRGVFAAVGLHRLAERPGTLVLLDDVVTSGATLACAAGELRGLRCQVYAAAVAGTQRQRLASRVVEQTGGTAWTSW